MRTITAIILLIIAIFSVDSYAEKYVRGITVLRKNVFDRELEKNNHFPFKLANNLHVITREHVIRREILFSSGDKFDQELLTESMRNIRTLEFIGDARVKTYDVAGDSIDIQITTEDLWTTVAGLSSEGGGGLYSITAYAEEKNIAGLGIGLEANATFASDDNDGFLIRAYDSRLLGTRNKINIIYSDFEFNSRRHLLLYRPFFSLDTRYTYSLNIYDDELIPRLFHQGDEFYRYKDDFTHIDISVGRAFGRYNRIEPYLFYHYTDHDYDLYTGYPDIGVTPEDETFSGPGTGLRLQTIRYITATYLDEFGSTEDLTEHITFRTIILWSGPTFNASSDHTSVTVEASLFYQPFDFLYAGYRNTYNSLYNGDLKRDRISNTMRGIVYLKPSEYQLLAIRAISQFNWHQKPNYQLTLGGDNGLRGYSDRYLNGTKLLLTNIEYRIFTPVKILTVGLGVAAFFDAGNVWDDREKVRIRDLKTNAGIGIRFGLTKSSTARVIRVDLARALNENIWYISFGTENIFNLDRYQ